MLSRFLLYIGHGRALELWLVILKTALSVWLLWIGHRGIAETPGLADLSWYYSTLEIALPFIALACVQGVGWSLNIAGYEVNWLFRAFGAICGVFLWMWLIANTSFSGQNSLLIPIGIAAIPANAFLWWKAINRLPVPGAVGIS